RHQHREHLSQWLPFHKYGIATAPLPEQHLGQRHHARDAHEEAYVERKIAGSGPVGPPARAEPVAVIDDDRADRKQHERNHDFRAEHAESASRTAGLLVMFRHVKNLERGRWERLIRPRKNNTGETFKSRPYPQRYFLARKPASLISV